MSLTPGGANRPYCRHRPVPAPDHDAVAEGGHLLQRGQVGGGGVKDVDEVGQGGLHRDELPQDLDGQAVVRLGQLEDVDVAGEQALHHAVSGQAVHVARRDVEQHPQGGGPDSEGGQAVRGRGGVGGGIPAQLHF